MSCKPIVVDENEPEIDVEEPCFDSNNIVIRKDKWVDEEYNILEFLGRGKYGEVKKCCKKRTNEEFAAKFICTPREGDKRDVTHEVSIMKKLQHKRIIQLYDAFEAKSEMCLVMEIIHGGELFERIIRDDFLLSEKACCCFIRQVCQGVEYIHSQNIMHLDIKPENILCLSRPGNRIKLIDFGLAQEFDPKKDKRILFGTAEFIAPEVVLFDPVTFATDMWSIGVVTYLLLSGVSPFVGKDETSTLSNVTYGKYDFSIDEFQSITQHAKDFIDKLLIINKKKRLTAQECLNQPWLQHPPINDEPHLDATKMQMKSYMSRKQWKKIINVVIAVNRMTPMKSSPDLLSCTGQDLITKQSQVPSSKLESPNPALNSHVLGLKDGKPANILHNKHQLIFKMPTKTNINAPLKKSEAHMKSDKICNKENAKNEKKVVNVNENMSNKNVTGTTHNGFHKISHHNKLLPNFIMKLTDHNKHLQSDNSIYQLSSEDKSKPSATKKISNISNFSKLRNFFNASGHHS